MTTASNAILTDSINPILATDTLSIGNLQTSGSLTIGTNAGRTGDIRVGSTTSDAPIYIDTNNGANVWGNPAISLMPNALTFSTLRLGESGDTIYFSNTVIQDGSMNQLNSSDTFNILTNQTGASGTLVIANATSRTGDINIATGGSSTCDINIHNGASSGSVGIANVTQATTVNIQSGTGDGTVTIGNSASTVALNGAVTLARPLGIISIPTPTNARLGFRTVNTMTGPTTAFTCNSTTGVIARQFSFAFSARLLVELRIQATTTATDVAMSFSTTANTITNSSERTVISTNAGVTTLSLMTVISASSGQLWYVNVRSSVPATFNNFYCFSTRIG